MKEGIHRISVQAVGRLGPTMYMGEAALQGSELSNSNVVAQTNVDLLQLQRSDAVRLLGTAFLQLVTQSTISTVKQVSLSRLRQRSSSGLYTWIGDLQLTSHLSS